MKLIDSMELIDSDVPRGLPRRASAPVPPISALRRMEPRGPAGPGAALLRAAVAAGLLGPGTLLAQAPEPPDDIEEVVVTSSRVPTPLRQIGTAVSVIEADEIRIRGYHSMADVLRTQPGIGVSNTGGPGKTTSLRIRGEEGYRTLVMIDGVDVSDPTGTQVGPSFDNLLTTSDIERVEILRGPQGFVYGADAGGVVNILTRRGEGPPAGQVAVELGDFDTRRTEASVSGGGGSADYFLSMTDLNSDGFNTQVSDTVLADDDGYENKTLHGKIGWTPTEELRVQLVGRDIDAVTEFDTCGFPTTADCIGRTDQTTFRLSGDYRAGAFTHLVAYSGTEVDRDNLAAGVISFATAGELDRAEYTGSFRPSESTTLVYGLDLEHEDVIASDGSELDQRQTGYYFEYQKAIDDRFFVTAGARHDDNDDFGTHTSVRATAAYVADVGPGALKYRASYGTGFRAPSPSELAYNAGPFAFPPAAGLSLTEESSKGFDIGVEYTADSGLHLEATWFDQRIEDEIFFDLAGFSGYLQSVGTSRSQGLELAAEVPVGMRWQLLANFTYNDTEDADGDQRIRRPETLANLGARFSSPDQRFRFIANYRLSRDAVDELFGIGRIPLEDYEVLDVSAAYAIGERIDVYARLLNVTDEKYQEVTGFNTAGSSASAGVRVRF